MLVVEVVRKLSLFEYLLEYFREYYCLYIVVIANSFILFFRIFNTFLENNPKIALSIFLVCTHANFK